ncbi:MAG: PepSY domain-containing protein [Hyphomicrobiales bacterium]
MKTKCLAFAAAALLSVALAGPASAKDVDIYINLGYGGMYGKNIKCWQAREIVEYRFNKVEKRDCHGRTYVFTGKRNGKWYYIYVSAYTGRIVDVNRWYR